MTEQVGLYLAFRRVPNTGDGTRIPLFTSQLESAGALTRTKKTKKNEIRCKGTDFRFS